MNSELKKDNLEELIDNSVDTIDYKDIVKLNNYISENGRIMPNRNTNITVKQQRKLSQAIKRARFLSLLNTRVQYK